MKQNAAHAVGLDRPKQPQGEKDDGHRARHVQVRIAAAEQRPIKMKRAVGQVMAPTDRAHARDETKPVYKENEDENGGEKPESLSDQLSADDALQEVVETFDQP